MKLMYTLIEAIDANECKPLERLRLLSQHDPSRILLLPCFRFMLLTQAALSTILRVRMAALDERVSP